MTWLRRVRPGLYVLGVAMVVGTLVGARALTAGNGSEVDGQKTANPAGNGNAKIAGPVIMGTVASAEPEIPYGLSPTLQSGTVAEVFVKSGHEVKAGDKLYAFETSIQSSDLGLAKIAVSRAQNEVAKANEAKKQHAKEVDVMDQAVKAAERNVKIAGQVYNLHKNNLAENFKTNGIPESQWDKKFEDNPELLKHNSDWLTAVSARDRLQSELDRLKAADVDLVIAEAGIAVKQAQAQETKAQNVVNLCTLTAKVDGTIERVTISPGTTLGISTREPALWLIPAGPRIVRGELEAEFAHKVGEDLKGKEVTIFDNFDPKLTYKGTVREIGRTFLPKRTEGLITSETRVLEVEIVVADPAPAGKPPLRVGQRVRVGLGQ